MQMNEELKKSVLEKVRKKAAREVNWPVTVLLILVSSILTPVFLKLLYGKNKGLPIGGAPETAMPQAEPNAEATAESSGQTEDNSVNDSQ